MKEPWMDTQAFRQSLPEFGQFNAEPLGKMAYRQFYGLHFQEPHKHHMGLFKVGGFEIVGQVFTPTSKAPRGTLFVYHGYFDHLGIYGFPIQIALSLGLTVVGFDLPGHGLSSGTPASIHCFSEYTKAQEAFIAQVQPLQIAPKPWFALGQSTGSAVILNPILTQAKRYYDHHILLAPLVRVANWYQVRLLYQLLRHKGFSPRTFRNNSANEEFVAFLRDKDPLQHRRIEAPWVGAMIRYTKQILKAQAVQCSVLVFQGDQDETVDFAFNMKFLQASFLESEIVMLKGAKHHLVNESPEHQKPIQSKLTQFIQSALEGK